MLSTTDVARIRAEIQTLEQARQQCIDGGIQKQIDVWIEAQKEKFGQAPGLHDDRAAKRA